MRNKVFTHLATIRMLQSVYSCYSTMANQLLKPFGLTLAQGEILMHLYQWPSESVETGELLLAIQISPTAVSNTLKRLRQNGYVDSIRKDDRRKKQIRLTHKAFELQKQITDVFRYLDDKFFFQITDAEYEAAEMVLHKTSQNISGIPVDNAAGKESCTKFGAEYPVSDRGQ